MGAAVESRGRRPGATGPLTGAVRRAALLASWLVLLAGVAAAEDPVRGTLKLDADKAVVEVTIAPHFHVNGHEPRDEFLVATVVDVKPPAGMTAGAVEYPTPIERKLSFSDTALLLYEGTVRFTASLSGSGTGPVRATLRYQACNDDTCLPPKTLELTATRDQPAAAVPAPVQPVAANLADNQIAQLVARWGTPITLFWIFLGGVALNLTPCVYPLISVTVSFFGGREHPGSGRAIGHAVLYALGICLTFTGLGVMAALTGSLFGAALQNPAVLGGVSLLLVALALSNFGVWQLRPPTALMQIAGRATEGAWGALFMGLTMGIVAAPCIGPFALGLLLYVGAQQDVWLGFVMFLALGLGLGAPYVVLAGAASNLRKLPRSGAWLGWMEHLFGFLLLAVALHFATPLLPGALVRVVWTVLLVTAGVVLGFLGNHGGGAMRGVRAAAGVAAIAVGLGGLVQGDTTPAIGWVPYSDAALADAATVGRPVLIDFQADWCIPCREMEHTTFRDPGVVEAASALAMLRADMTSQNDDDAALMARYQVVGVPTYLLLDRSGKERRRFIGLVPADEMRAAMTELNRG